MNPVVLAMLLVVPTLAVSPDMLIHTQVILGNGPDPLYGKQWALRALDAERAWAIETGNANITVAILDTGIDPTHPDLNAPLYAPWDGYGHGTHVAGIINAKKDNGIGIAGLAPGVRVITIKALSDAGIAPWPTLWANIKIATDLGANIISMSLGGFCGEDNCALVNESIEYATNHGVLLVAAAGNEGCAYMPWDCVIYPAIHPSVISVSATHEDGHLSWFSSAGKVDFAAPGEDIISTMAPASFIGTRYCETVPAQYCVLSGTSMATPHVAASAALVWSHCPNLTASQVRERLNVTARPDGTARQYGHGFVQPAVALSLPCY